MSVRDYRVTVMVEFNLDLAAHTSDDAHAKAEVLTRGVFAKDYARAQSVRVFTNDARLLTDPRHD